MAFTEKLEGATAGHFQITTDGFAAYFDAIHTVWERELTMPNLSRFTLRQPRANTAIRQPAW